MAMIAMTTSNSMRVNAKVRKGASGALPLGRCGRRPDPGLLAGKLHVLVYATVGIKKSMRSPCGRKSRGAAKDHELAELNEILDSRDPPQRPHGL